jgi:hypothetical protein
LKRAICALLALVLSAVSIGADGVHEPEDDDRDSPSPGWLLADRVSPKPGSTRVRPGTPVVFSLSGLPEGYESFRQQIVDGHFRVLVYQSRPDGSKSLNSLEPGTGSVYDPKTDSVHVSIPDAKPLTHYLVLVSTSPGYRPKIWPIDSLGQKVVLGYAGHRPVYFGMHDSASDGAQAGPPRSGLTPGDRLVRSGQSLLASSLRHMNPYPLSTLFVTGPLPGTPERLSITCGPSRTADDLIPVHIVAKDAYDQPCPSTIRVSLAERGKADGSCRIFADSIETSPGRLDFAVWDPEPEAVDVIITVRDGTRQLTGSTTLSFVSRDR